MIDPSRTDMFKSRRDTCLFGAPVQGIGAQGISRSAAMRASNPDLKRASDIRHQTGMKQKPTL